jgi:hypothetical protein
MQRLVELGHLPVPAGLTAAGDGRRPLMKGVAAIVPVESAFADLIREALEHR